MTLTTLAARAVLAVVAVALLAACAGVHIRTNTALLFGGHNPLLGIFILQGVVLVVAGVAVGWLIVWAAMNARGDR